NNKQEIFLSENDYLRFLIHIKLAIKKMQFKLYAYCLMPNHFHLLMEVNECPVSSIMHQLLTSYAKYFNLKYNKQGHLFQGRYKAIICEKDSYLLELVRYIHLNPVRAAIADSPTDWKWSGHNEYVSEVPLSLIDKEKILLYFDSNIEKARIKYSEFVSDGLKMGQRKDFYPKEKISCLGNELFKKELALRQKKVIEEFTKAKEAKKMKSLYDLTREVSDERKIPLGLIQCMSRATMVSAVRKEFIEKALNEGHKAIDIANFLRRTPAYITKIRNSLTIS
ncbi:MAG: transposase, partial [Elusimicrobia bacterium]|nr:transposase [Elusimicrobiota bacterium]